MYIHGPLRAIMMPPSPPRRLLYSTKRHSLVPSNTQLAALHVTDSHAQHWHSED